MTVADHAPAIRSVDQGFNPITVASLAIENQATDLVSRALFTPPVTGMYRFSMVSICNKISTHFQGSQLNFTLAWTDDVKAESLSDPQMPHMNLSGLGYQETQHQFRAVAGQPINLSAQITSNEGGPLYSLYIFIQLLP
jgi:hypothetical protein